MPWADAAHAQGLSIALTDRPAAARFSSAARNSVSKRPHLAGGSGLLCNSATADNPAHRRVTSQAVGVVHVLIATEAAEDGLAKQSCQRMPAVLAGARVIETIANHVGQPERVIEFAIGEQSGVGGDPGAMKLELQAAVEFKPQRLVLRFHPPGPSSVSPPDAFNTLILIAESVKIRIN